VGHGVAAAVVDLVGRITCRGRAGMPSTARSESFEAVDVRTALRGSNHQASKRGVIGEGEHGRCARLDTRGNSPLQPQDALGAGRQIGDTRPGKAFVSQCAL
jgi:hypothetical protein